jgi:hypothetical protein
LKIFPGVIPPDPRSRGGEGGKEREDGRGKEGITDTVGEEGVVWDREGEEGVRVIQRKGKGREEGKGGRKEEEDDLAPPQKKFLDPPLITDKVEVLVNHSLIFGMEISGAPIEAVTTSIYFPC